jgi:hypothetical protein
MVRAKRDVLQDGQWLAILDGRFLPIEQLDISVSRETEDIVATSSLQKSGTVTTAELMSGTIETRREPAIKDRPTSLRLYGPDKQYHIWNITISRRTRSADNTYVIDFDATDWKVTTR